MSEDFIGQIKTEALFGRRKEEKMKTISLLGSTGSIGTQTLDVIRRNKDIKVAALAEPLRNKRSKNWQHRHVNLSRNWSASAVKNWQAI